VTNTLAIVAARLNSSRLPGKHLLKLANEPMITQLWRRLMQCKDVDAYELATTADAFNQPLINWANSQGITCNPFEGDVNDLMARIDAIIKRQEPDYILYICGDCPLIDPGFIDHALSALKASGKDSIMLADGVTTLHEGMSFYSRRGWDKLMTVSQCTMSREHVGYADKLTPVLDRLAIPDSDDYSRFKHRISVDTHADFRFMAEIYRRWYKSHAPDSIVSLAWVQQQLIEDKRLSALNAHVKQKAANRHYAKASIYCHLGTAVGLGHFKRAELIANALQEYLGIGASIHAQCDSPHLIDAPGNLQWHQDENALLSTLTADTNSLIVIDLHPDFISLSALKQALQQAREKGIKLVGIDKLSPLVDELDWLFIPSFNKNFKHPKVSVGWQNYLFTNIPECRKKSQILVLTGGSDALGYGTELPAWLDDIRTDWPIVWVKGPLAPFPNLQPDSGIKVLTNPDHLNFLLAESEIILSCYGLSLFESIFARAATILLPPQHLCCQEELNQLSKEHCCLISDSLPDAISKLKGLLTDTNIRESLQNEASRVFSNHVGIEGLIKEITQLLQDNSQ